MTVPACHVRLSTPAAGLTGILGLLVQRGLGRDAALDAVRAVTGLAVRDLQAIERREALPAGPDLRWLQSAAHLVEVDPRALLYRAEMHRDAARMPPPEGMPPGEMDEDEMPEEHPSEDDEKRARYRFVLSTSTPDRAEDIVEQDWRLDAFRRNPVAPFGHRYGEPAIGTWPVIDVRGGRLIGMLQPEAIESYPLSVTVAEQLRRRVLRTCSVGFSPEIVIPRASLPEADPRFGRRGYVLRGNALLECSVVPVPMNPDAEMREAPPVPASRGFGWMRAK